LSNCKNPTLLWHASSAERGAYDIKAEHKHSLFPALSINLFTTQIKSQNSADPDQILRYCFGAPRPLWVHAASQLGIVSFSHPHRFFVDVLFVLSVGDPPACDNCGGKRVFELQLLPQVMASCLMTSRYHKFDCPSHL
jgi:hypothetical protein